MRSPLRNEMSESARAVYAHSAFTTRRPPFVIHFPGLRVRTMSAGGRDSTRVLGSPVYRVSSDDGHAVNPASFLYAGYTKGLSGS